MEKNYTIVDKWLDLGKENVVNVKSVDGVIEGGGGGDSDFSIAKVTVTSRGGNLYIPNIFTNGEVQLLRNFYSAEGVEPVTLDVPMYKGVCGVLLLEGYEISVSGNAQKQGDSVIITGDCTITVS